MISKFTSNEFSVPKKDKLNFIIDYLETTGENLIITFDDVHLIYEKKDLLEFIKKLISSTSNNIQFILILRHKIKEKFYDLIIKMMLELSMMMMI